MRYDYISSSGEAFIIIKEEAIMIREEEEAVIEMTVDLGEVGRIEEHPITEVVGVDTLRILMEMSLNKAHIDQLRQEMPLEIGNS